MSPIDTPIAAPTDTAPNGPYAVLEKRNVRSIGRGRAEVAIYAIARDGEHLEVIWRAAVAAEEGMKRIDCGLILEYRYTPLKWGIQCPTDIMWERATPLETLFGKAT